MKLKVTLILLLLFAGCKSKSKDQALSRLDQLQVKVHNEGNKILVATSEESYEQNKTWFSNMSFSIIEYSNLEKLNLSDCFDLILSSKVSLNMYCFRVLKEDPILKFVYNAKYITSPFELNEKNKVSEVSTSVKSKKINKISNESVL